MPEVSQQDIDRISSKLDTILKMQIDIKKELADLRAGHNATAFALRRQGGIRK